MKSKKSIEAFEKNMAKVKSNINQYKDNFKKIEENSKQSVCTENNKEYQPTEWETKINNFFENFDVYLKNCFFGIVNFFKRIITTIRLFCKKWNGMGGILLVYLLVMIFSGIMFLINS